jgi:hypothetical protein
MQNAVNRLWAVTCRGAGPQEWARVRVGKAGLGDDVPAIVCYDQVGRDDWDARPAWACLKTAVSLRLSVLNKEHRDDLPHLLSPP